MDKQIHETKMKPVFTSFLASLLIITGLMAAEAPLTICSGEKYSAEAVDITSFAVLSDNDIPKMIGEKAVSMILRKGHSLCIGTEKTGNGMSKVIIAGTRDVKIPLLSDEFRQYMHDVHEKYGLPIWITEFNCSPGREQPLQIEFMKLAIPWLDKQDFVERYAYFQPSGGNGDFNEVRNDSDSPLTAMGILYRDHESVPELKDGVWLGSNNLCGPEVEERSR